MVDGRCCRGHTRSRFLRAAGSGGIFGGSGKLEACGGCGDNGIDYYERGGNTALDVLAPCSPSQFHAEGFITHDTAYSLLLSARNLTYDEFFYSNYHSEGDLGRLASHRLAQVHHPLWLSFYTSHSYNIQQLLFSPTFIMRLRKVLRTPLSIIRPRKLTGFEKVTSILELRQKRRKALLAEDTVGFVPTMGALHQGHLALIRQAARENDQVYVSIYVNPTQFGANEDLKSYPRTSNADTVKLAALSKEFKNDNQLGHMSVIFEPSTKDMYPCSPPSSELDGHGSFVTITPLSSRLEGASRPVFFRGVATVCMKLLNIVQPDRVYFGQKDVQQTFVVKRMVQDFHLNTEVRVGPTVREKDGLAMSSRNVYLGERRRKVALVLLDSLREVQKVFARGARKRQFLYNAAIEKLSLVEKQQYALPKEKRVRFEVDYISIADPDTLDELEEVDPERGAILSGAIKMLPLEEPQEGEDAGLGGGKSTVRLIDNIRLELLSAKVGYIP